MVYFTIKYLHQSLLQRGAYCYLRIFLHFPTQLISISLQLQNFIILFKPPTSQNRLFLPISQRKWIPLNYLSSSLSPHICIHTHIFLFPFSYREEVSFFFPSSKHVTHELSPILYLLRNVAIQIISSLIASSSAFVESLQVTTLINGPHRQIKPPVKSYYP